MLMVSVVASCASCGKREKASAPAEINNPAPPFTLTDLSGKKVSLADYKGSVVVLEFFTTWCGPCMLVAPEVQSVHERYRDKGLVVLAISLDEGSNALASVKTFKKEYGISFALLMNDGTVGKQYGVFSIPTSFVIDRQGKITAKHMGMIPDLSKILSKEIETLL